MSDGSGSKGKKTRGCLFYGVVVFFVAPILLVLLVLVGVILRDASAHRKLQTRVDQLDAQGLPYDSPSMQVYYSSLTSDQNTQDWLLILDQLGSDGFIAGCKGLPIVGGDAEVPLDNQTAWPQERATLAFVAKWDGLHERTVDVASRGGAVRFPVKFDSYDTQLPQAQKMRSAARMLKLWGQLAIRQRDSAALRENLDALYGCGEVLSGDPIFVSQLISIAIDSVGMALLQDGLEHGLLDQEDLQHFIKKSMAKSQIGPDWKRWIHGERAMTLPVFRGESEVSPSGGASGQSLPFRGHDANTYMDLTDQVLTIDTDDLDQFLAGCGQLDSKMVSRLNNAGLIQRFDSVLTDLVLPAFRGGGIAFVRRAGAHRIAVLAMGTRIYYLKNDAFPETLDDLKSVGLDADQLMPVGGKRFGYQVDDQGALLWGFSASAGQSVVPPQPPKLDPKDPSSEDMERWIWRVSK